MFIYYNKINLLFNNNIYIYKTKVCFLGYPQFSREVCVKFGYNYAMKKGQVMPEYLRARYAAMMGERMKSVHTAGLWVDQRTGMFLWEIWDAFESRDTVYVDAKLGECQRCFAGIYNHQSRCMFCGCVRKGRNSGLNATYPQIELADI
jgi:hypothetical protein